jgi:hypothetical protein
MRIDYPVELLPSRLFHSDDSEKLASPGEKIYAVISNNKIIAKSKEIPQLGINYRKYILEHVQDKEVRIVSYECPFNELHTKEAIFNVKPLGVRFHDFYRGELHSLVNLEKKDKLEALVEIDDKNTEDDK